VKELLARADNCSRHGDKDGAIKALLLAVDSLREGTEDSLLLECAHWGLADIYMAKREMKKAEQHLKQAIKLNPGEARYHQELGAVYNYQARFLEAARQFEKSLELRPAHPETTHLLGWAVFMAGDQKRGQQIMELSLELDDTNTGTLNDLAVCLMEQGQARDALLVMERACTIDPKNELLRSFKEMVAKKAGV
jgi:tetratricopeptide (TPR) repeat protein